MAAPCLEGSWGPRGPRRSRVEQDKVASLGNPRLLHDQNSMKRQTQIKLALEQTRLAFNAGEIQARGVSKFHVDANVSRPAFDGKFRNRLPVIAFKAFRQAKHSGQNA